VINVSAEHPLKNIIKSQKKGIPTGIYSVCSANEIVIQVAMEKALNVDSYVLIEATANQVNQYGGYTNMRPIDFRDFVYTIAEKVNFPKDRIILGGDHLGPLPWKSQQTEKAMKEAKELIKQFVMSGFTKIHIDTSMLLGDDGINTKLDIKTIAERGAILVSVAERAFEEFKKFNPYTFHPVYVIGSEVPIPGGSQEENCKIQITKPADFEETVEVYRNIFNEYGLQDAWENVIAVVVQPGVEFGIESINEYNHLKAKDLVSALKKYSNLVYEAHSTDYQSAKKLKEMVKDGFAILKVGPALTFALREGLFALNMIEKELFKGNRGVEMSNFIDVLDTAMINNSKYWEQHYHGENDKIRIARKYSYSDRCRYYLNENEVRTSISVLFKNLKNINIPLTLISQYMPIQYEKIRMGLLKNDPETLVKDRIGNCIDRYLYATNPAIEIFKLI
jgi:D-tagatose-1,6-bisphosphate aldolase subunit GatZ/KbaZ